MGREIKRVPVDWDWPLNKTWSGYLLTDEEEARFAEDSCPECENGYSPLGKYLHDLWYGYVPFSPPDNGSQSLTHLTPEVRAFAERNVTRDEGSLRFYTRDYFGHVSVEVAIVNEATRLATLWNGMWCHHLNQADVDALIEAGRLMDFTHRWTKGEGWQRIEPAPVITAEQVNRWSLQGFGHDSLNAMIAVNARCEREGQPSTCQTCHGHGSLERRPGQRSERDTWTRTEPPTGEGWQLWETVSEGSPVSPVFATAEELARWLTTGVGTGTPNHPNPMPISAARKFVEAGWSPTLIGDGGGLHNGADYVGTSAVLAEIEGAS